MKAKGWRAWKSSMVKNQYPRPRPADEGVVRELGRVPIDAELHVMIAEEIAEAIRELDPVVVTDDGKKEHPPEAASLGKREPTGITDLHLRQIGLGVPGPDLVNVMELELVEGAGADDAGQAGYHRRGGVVEVLEVLGRASHDRLPAASGKVDDIVLAPVVPHREPIALADVEVDLPEECQQVLGLRVRAFEIRQIGDPVLRDRGSVEVAREPGDDRIVPVLRVEGEEEEGLVFRDGPTDAGAELLLIE